MMTTFSFLGELTLDTLTQWPWGLPKTFKTQRRGTHMTYEWGKGPSAICQ